MKTKLKVAGLALLAGLVAVPIALAQAPADPADPGDPAVKADRKQRRAARKAKFQAKRAEFFRQELGLSNADAGKLEAALDGYRKQMKSIRKQQRTLMGKLQQLLDEGSKDAQAYEYNVRALRYNKAQMDKIKQAREDLLAKTLTPKQQAQMLVKFKRGHKGGKHHWRGKRGHRGMRGGGPAGF